MQPDAEGATAGPRGRLAWGQLNFMHTTDTHGWLEGHIKEKNYGADWGDFVSFVKAMRSKASELDVDLLLVDTGDLHDGAGLSDATPLNGQLSNPIFEKVDYDLLTIGNHELYVTQVAYETFSNFSAHYGDRYLTSNVQIMNPKTSQFEYIGKTHRYFTTPKGLRIMAFGILFDFTGNSNVSKVIPAKQMVQQDWFQHAIKTHKPVDLFVLIGHNPVRSSLASSTFDYVFNAIRAVHPDTPIQIFGGHTHIRDFAVYDDKSTALESGRYCETLGWLSISGFKSPKWKGCNNPRGVPNPTMKAVNINPPKSTSTSTTTASNAPPPLASSTSPSNLRYSRRYLDWNRLTFEYHARGSQYWSFDSHRGEATTKEITQDRKELNLTKLYGCAPQTWCVSCAPFGSDGNIYTLLSKALATVVINKTRADKPRMYISNTGSIRFDLVKGPFTFDDSFIVSPFNDAFEFIPDVPFSAASHVLATLNAGAYEKRSLTNRDFGFHNPSLPDQDACVDPPVTEAGSPNKRSLGRVVRNTKVTPGYVTSDDFGTDGDDTIHTPIPYYAVPNDYSANASFPADGSMPTRVDFIFLDFIAKDVVNALNKFGTKYTLADVSYYLPLNYTTNTFVTEYAKVAPDWQKDVPNCPVGLGVGYNDTASS
ncbi:secreted protein [Acrodontium crateriforme]|uniref:Secreted protein n=1 Tax=Acrodontium crateriforme TaxID=150365 RepID=A0AAQ3RBE4_9PEZI|nr:secreted protein [Acrodontium crateriforme]